MLQALYRLLFRFNHWLCLVNNHAPESVGGQAVMEGVMMRSPRRLAVAVRDKDGAIVLDDREFIPYSKRRRIWGFPVLRGAASLIEALIIGIRALNFSIEVMEGKRSSASTPSDATESDSNQASQNGESSFSRKSTLSEKLVMGLSMALSFLAAMALFQLLPYFVAGTLVGGTKETTPNPFLFNFTAGCVRISLLLAYMWGISHLPDIRRVFQYHGAEHKSIFAHEAEKELTVESAGAQTRFHPRCGTSFLLIVALVCILFFSCLDALILYFFPGAYPTFFHRFLAHLPFVPVVAGLAFEVLKWTARHQDSSWVRPLILPGLWLQRITTQEPDDSQLEVAIASIHGALRTSSPLRT